MANRDINQIQKLSTSQVKRLQSLIAEVEAQYREACRELARLSAKSGKTDSQKLEGDMYIHATARLEYQQQLRDMGYTHTQITAIELAERTRGQLQAARENGVD